MSSEAPSAALVARTPRWRDVIWAAVRVALRENVKPGAAIFAIACTLLALFYLSDAARGFLTAVGDFKNAGGFAFSTVSTSIAGGVLPYTIAAVRTWRADGARVEARRIAFYTAFWAYKGVEVSV